jgi:DNA-binding NtrC family response regulator
MAFKDIHILLVDDDENINEIVAEAFSDEGFQVTSAVDGQEALDLWKKDPLKFKVVITDLTMPKLNGIELLTAIHEIADIKAAPLCYLASGCEDKMSDQNLKEKISVVSKPYDVFSFVDQVSRDLESR